MFFFLAGLEFLEPLGVLLRVAAAELYLESSTLELRRSEWPFSTSRKVTAMFLEDECGDDIKTRKLRCTTGKRACVRVCHRMLLGLIANKAWLPCTDSW